MVDLWVKILIKYFWFIKNVDIILQSYLREPKQIVIYFS